MSRENIPAPGFKTYPKGKVFLVDEALGAVRALADRGERVSLQAVAVLVILCDAVKSTHGQWYGAWDHTADGRPGLIDRYPWDRSTWFRHLATIEELGLVENLGRLPGRRTTTYQLLPHLYRLVSQNRDTTDLVSQDHDTTAEANGEATGHDVVSQNSDTDSRRTATPVVSQKRASLVSQARNTNPEPVENPEKNPGLTPRSRSELNQIRGRVNSMPHYEMVPLLHELIDDGTADPRLAREWAELYSHNPVDHIDQIEDMFVKDLRRLLRDLITEALQA